MPADDELVCERCGIWKQDKCNIGCHDGKGHRWNRYAPANEGSMSSVLTTPKLDLLAEFDASVKFAPGLTMDMTFQVFGKEVFAFGKRTHFDVMQILMHGVDVTKLLEDEKFYDKLMDKLWGR